MYAGSNPVLTSQQNNCFVSAIGAAVARFPDTEEVTGSIPVSRTNEALILRNQGFCVYLFGFLGLRRGGVLLVPVRVLEAVLRIFPPRRRRGPALASLRAP